MQNDSSLVKTAVLIKYKRLIIMITLNSSAMLSLKIFDLKISVIQLEIQFKSYLKTSKSIHEKALSK